MVSMVLHIPGSIWVFVRAEGWGLDNFVDGLAMNVVSRLLPDSYVALLLDLLPAEALGN